MQKKPEKGIVDILEAEQRKRDAFLNQMVSILENTLSKIEVNSKSSKGQ
ncbi:hypothetical protein WMZ97_00850 [Lentibacillus sp. N15]